MAQIFVYFVCALCIWKLEMRKLEHSKNKITRELWPMCVQSVWSIWGAMLLYRYFAKASKQSELPNPNGALSASLPQRRRHFDRTLALPWLVWFFWLTWTDLRTSNGRGLCGCLVHACANLFRILKYKNLFWRVWGQLYENLHQRKFPAIRYAVHEMHGWVAPFHQQYLFSQPKAGTLWLVGVYVFDVHAVIHPAF